MPYLSMECFSFKGFYFYVRPWTFIYLVEFSKNLMEKALVRLTVKSNKYKTNQTYK